MKKKLFCLLGMAVLCTSVYFKSINQNDQTQVPDLLFTNVEALASGEWSYGSCGNYGCRFDYYYTCYVSQTGSGIGIMTCPNHRG